MNKKTRRIKKDIKRNLRDIGYKKACKSLKQAFYKEFKTAIYDSSYFNYENSSNFHPAWRVLQQPLIEEIEDGNTVENSGCFLPLNTIRATNTILYWKKFNKVLVSCYNFQHMELNWTTI